MAPLRPVEVEVAIAAVQDEPTRVAPLRPVEVEAVQDEPTRVAPLRPVPYTAVAAG